jgi:hypothetical protein
MRKGIQMVIRFPKMDETKEWKAGDQLITPEAALELGVSEAWISQLCREGRIEGAVKRGRFWLIPYESLQKIEYREGGRPPKSKSG